MSKEGLQTVIQQDLGESEKLHGNFVSAEDLRDLFRLHEDAKSEIHENMNCVRCNTNDLETEDSNGYLDVNSKDSSGVCQTNQPSDDIGGFAELAGCLHKLKNSERQIGCPHEDLKNWGHHTIPETVPDAILHAAAGDEVTFVFTNQVDGKLVPVESTVKTTSNEANDQIPIKAEHAEFNEKTARNSPRSLGIPIIKGSFKSLKTPVNPLHSPRMPPTISHSLFRKSTVSNSSDDDFI